MGAHAGRLSLAKSARRVLVEGVDLAELAKAAELLPAPRIIESGGFTVDDLAAEVGRPRTTVGERLRAMVRAGKAEIIGRRPGRNGAKVYRVR